MTGTVTKGLALREDLDLYDGITLTSSRTDSTGGTLSGLRIGDDVDVLSVYGGGTSYTWATIQSAINAVGSSSAAFRFAPGTWVVDDDLTLPTNIHAIVSAGAVFAISSGKTLTLNGGVTRYSPTWYSGAGSVAASDILASVKDYGALGDGTTNDTVAVQAAFTAVVNAGVGKVYFPAGDYLLSTQVTVAPSLISLLVHGDGQGVSRILVPAASAGGISVAATDLNSTMTVKDISIICTGASAGTALEFTTPEGGNQHRRGFHAQRVHIGPDDPSTDYFDTGVNVTGAWRPLIDGCIVGGPFGAGISDLYTDASLQYASAVGIDYDGCYHPELTNSYVWSANVGVSCISTAGGSEPEGLRLSNTNIAGVRVGVDFGRTTQEPTFWAHNMHINFRDRGLQISGCKLVNISGLASYQQDTAPFYSGVPADIYLNNVDAVNIHDNVFHFEGATTRRNIDIDAATAATNIVITNNLFNCNRASGTCAAGVYIHASATNVVIANNKFPVTSNYTVEVDDQSGAATIYGPGTNAEPGFLIESQDDAGLAFPVLTLFRDSASPVAADNIGAISWDGRTSTGARIDYALLKGIMTDPTNGSVDGSVALFVMKANTETNILTADSAEATGSSGAGSTGVLVRDPNGATTYRIKMGADNSGPGGAGRALFIDNQ